MTKREAPHERLSHGCSPGLEVDMSILPDGGRLVDPLIDDRVLSPAQRAFFYEFTVPRRMGGRLFWLLDELVEAAS